MYYEITRMRYVCVRSMCLLVRSEIYNMIVLTIYIETQTHSQVCHCKLKLILTISLNNSSASSFFFYAFEICRNCTCYNIRHIKNGSGALTYKACHCLLRSTIFFWHLSLSCFDWTLKHLQKTAQQVCTAYIL